MSRAASTGRIATATLIGLLTVATLAGFLDQLSWVFEPASFFRLQYAGVLAIAAVAALALRRFRLAGLAAVMAGINIAAIAPWHSAENPVASPGAPVVRVVAFNVDGANHRYGELAHLIERLKPDILGLTEWTPA